MQKVIQTINEVIVSLDKLSVQGTQNMAIVLTAIQQLAAARQELEVGQHVHDSAK